MEPLKTIETGITEAKMNETKDVAFRILEQMVREASWGNSVSGNLISRAKIALERAGYVFEIDCD